MAAIASAHQQAHGWREGALVWRCYFCTKVLGFVTVGQTRDAVKIRHYKREIECEGVNLTTRQVCDDCLAENHWPVARNENEETEEERAVR